MVLVVLAESSRVLIAIQYYYRRVLEALVVIMLIVMYYNLLIAMSLPVFYIGKLVKQKAPSSRLCQSVGT